MASTKPFLGKDSSINRPPYFIGECYDFCKIRMQMFIESHGVEVWNAVEEGPFVTTSNVGGAEQPKLEDVWNEDDKKKIQHDKKTQNILALALELDEFFIVSNCKTAKEIWETLETTNEGTKEVKRSRLNMISQEYEMFRM